MENSVVNQIVRQLCMANAGTEPSFQVPTSITSQKNNRERFMTRAKHAVVALITHITVFSIQPYAGTFSVIAPFPKETDLRVRKGGWVQVSNREGEIQNTAARMAYMRPDYGKSRRQLNTLNDAFGENPVCDWPKPATAQEKVWGE